MSVKHCTVQALRDERFAGRQERIHSVYISVRSIALVKV